MELIVDAEGEVAPRLAEVTMTAAQARQDHTTMMFYDVCMLARDVRNITQYYSLFAPELLDTKYAKEMWALYESRQLSAEARRLE